MQNLTTSDEGEGHNILEEDVQVLADLKFGHQPETAVQRLRTFLAYEAGTAWGQARIVTYASPDGAHVHLAFAPMRAGKAMVVVMESADGDLSLPRRLETEGQEQVGDMLRLPTIVGGEYEEELRCLKQIQRAFTQIGKRLVADEQLKPRRKSWLIGQLSHATSHLIGNLENKMKRQ